jgi:hypothetical protein
MPPSSDSNVGVGAVLARDVEVDPPSPHQPRLEVEHEDVDQPLGEGLGGDEGGRDDQVAAAP